MKSATLEERRAPLNLPFPERARLKALHACNPRNRYCSQLPIIHSGAIAVTTTTSDFSYGANQL